MVRLVRTAAKVADAHLGSFGIIGGVAVSARLGQAHCATADIDTVVDDLTPAAVSTSALATPGTCIESSSTSPVPVRCAMN